MPGETTAPSSSDSQNRIFTPADSVPNDPDLNPAGRTVTTDAIPGAGDLSITVSTDLLSRFVEDQRIETNNVVTRVMEADVRGVQTTVTNVRLQSVECPSMARLHILSQGAVNSDTVGFTPQARVSTAGNHSFDVIKPVYFDGTQFLTKPAYGGLQARQFPRAVNSIASGIPLFGPLGDQIAWREVMRRQPMSDSIVVRKVADDVLPKVNSATDQKLFELNRKLHDFRRQLDPVFGSDTLALSASSTSTTFTTKVVNQSATRYEKRLGISLVSTLAANEKAAIVVSEDGINHLLGKLPLAGLTASDAALQKIVAAVKDAGTDYRSIVKVLANRADFDAEPLMFSLKFADVAPLTIAFDGGQLHVSLKFQVVPKQGEPSVLQHLRLQLGGQSEAEGKWSIALKRISVTPASPDDQPDSWTKLINNQATAIVDRIPPTELPRVINLSQFHPKLPAVRIYRIQATTGQLRISFDSDESSVTTRRIPYNSTCPPVIVWP